MSGTFVAQNWQSVWEDAKGSLPADAITSAIVGDPETSGTMLRKHVVYNVRTRFHVKRRYADFEALRKRLASKYFGMFIPYPPQKHPDAKTMATGNKINAKSAFIINRSAQLNIFLNAILANPFISQDSLVESFLSTTDRKEWEKLRDSGNAPNLFEEVSEGAQAWRKIIRNLPDTYEAESLSRTTVEHLEALKSSLADAHREALSACAYSQTLTDSMKGFSAQSLMWAGKEIGVESARGQVGDQEQTKKNMESLVMTANNMEINCLAINRVMVTIIFPNLMHQICMIDGLRDLITRMDEQKKIIEKTQKEIMSLTNKKEDMNASKKDAGAASGRRGSIMGTIYNMTSTTDKVEGTLKGKEDTLAEYRRVYSYMERALAYSEVSRFFVERNLRLMNLSSISLASNEAIVSKMHSTCTDILNKFGIVTALHKGKLGHIFEASDVVAIEHEDEEN